MDGILIFSKFSRNLAHIMVINFIVYSIKHRSVGSEPLGSGKILQNYFKTDVDLLSYKS